MDDSDQRRLEVIHKETLGDCLRMATMNNEVQLVKKLLLSEKVNINDQDRSGTTALHLACLDGFEEVVQILMSSPQLDVNKFDMDMNTPLMSACISGHLGVVRLLLARDDVNVNAQNKEGRTALKMACDFGDTEIIKMLRSSTRSSSISKDSSLAVAYSSDSHIFRGALETLDKAAKAREEWNNMMKDLDKLQEVNKELREKILVKEKEFDGHKIKITEMMNYISINSKTEDLKKKKYMDTEMTKMKVKEAAITKDIERLNEALRSNIKALRRGWLWS